MKLLSKKEETFNPELKIIETRLENHEFIFADLKRRYEWQTKEN